MHKIVFSGSKDIPFITIDNWYNEEELKEVWEEIESLTKPSILLPPELTGSATTNTGMLIKRNHGVFLDGYYAKDRDKSAIIRNFVKKFEPYDIKAQIARHNWFLDYITKFNYVSSLLSYYEEGDAYLPHSDNCLITICIHLFKEPQCFTGGELCIEHTTLPLTNNRLVLFPGVVKHSVNPVKFNEENKPYSGNGRYTVTHFLDYDFFGARGIKP